MTLQINLSPEDNKLLFLTLRFLTKKMILVKMSSEVRILGEEVLEPISITKVAEIVVFTQMFEQILIINESLITELTQRMSCKLHDYKAAIN